MGRKGLQSSTLRASEFCRSISLGGLVQDIIDQENLQSHQSKVFALRPPGSLSERTSPLRVTQAWWGRQWSHSSQPAPPPQPQPAMALRVPSKQNENVGPFVQRARKKRKVSLKVLKYKAFSFLHVSLPPVTLVFYLLFDVTSLGHGTPAVLGAPAET